ncbi:SH3 domain-containing protein [Candidatus Soleaferrea massiliensis]|uniref:SH3 domain-containing protein n=1 Tax=Candidatus Soleaferrea massiliensis TaxID=1470354 RepID=UPI00058B67DE|nr:SH3 domain-containing protein [Candidatus Soleaferrea massiliensis]
MPTIYLSPSTQEWNQYVTGNSEEYYMNLIADAMIPYLRSNGIQYVRNTPQMTAASSIQASNAGNYDLHLALHSNAAPESLSGRIRGTDVYYNPSNWRSRRAAEIIADNLRTIYPLPDRVQARPTDYLGEVIRTRAPGVLIEFAYHDNVDDANWIINNIQPIAENVVMSLTEYFDIPFIQPQAPQIGVVNVRGANLNVRSRPNTGAPIVGRLANGQTVTVWGEWNGWYVIDSDGLVGYVAGQYIDL